MHEGIPILNFLVPQGIPARERPADRHDLREGARRCTTTRADARWCRPANPTSAFDCDEVLVAVGQENAFPWIERDCRHRRSTSPACRCSTASTLQSSLPRRVLRRRCGARPEEHHLGRRAGPRCGDLDRQVPARRGRARAPGAGRDAACRRRWASTSGATTTTSRRTCASRCPGATSTRRCATSRSKSNSDSTRRPRGRRRSAASTATCRPCSRDRSASSATPASTSARPTASRSRRTARRPNCARGCVRPRCNRDQALYVSGGLKTGRVMVKDEDVCLHCGLCAERCPTGAWDMQKFLLELTPAGRGCRTPHREAA